jgi:hypothetical protein
MRERLYTVFCIDLGGDVPFHIIERNKTVAELKELLKEKNCVPFADIESTSLDLYHVDIADNDQLVTKMKAHPLDSRLQATKLLTSIFSATPKANTVHFIVNHPSKLHG